MTSEVSLYDAKTHLSALVERAAGGEEIVITKKGSARAKLVPVGATTGRRTGGQNLLQVSYIAPDFDEADPFIEALFYGSDQP